jgi:hypothetical protein
MKPIEHIFTLINAVSDPLRIQNGRERQIISLLQYAEPMSFILHEGIAAWYRGKDHLLLANIKAPVIVGLNFLLDKNQDIYFQARGAIRFEIVPQSMFSNAVSEQNLWESMAYMYMFSTRRFLENHFVATGVSTYDLVRNNLQALMEETEELRLATTACDYIQEKTMLSRSGIMKMLGDLKKGGHIDLQRGVLMQIYKLPLKY